MAEKSDEENTQNSKEQNNEQSKEKEDMSEEELKLEKEHFEKIINAFLYYKLVVIIN